MDIPNGNQEGTCLCGFPDLYSKIRHRERGCLTHVDRIDALAVSHLQNSLQVNVKDAARAMKEAEEEKAIKAWLRQHEHAFSGDRRVCGTGWHEFEDYKVLNVEI